MNVNHCQFISLFSFKQFLNIPTNNWKSNRVWISPPIECNVTTLNALFRGLKESIYKPENLFMLITESKKKKKTLKMNCTSEGSYKNAGKSEDFFIVVLASSQIRIKNSCVLSQITWTFNVFSVFNITSLLAALIDSSLLYLSLVTKDLLINTCAKGS